jgi:hypothetical protein
MIAMKKLPVENLGFVEIGGVGEMIYRAVRFPEYVPDYDDDGEVLKPVFTGLHAPESGTDYSLTGQELLVSLCNLSAIAEMRNKNSDSHGIGAKRINIDEHHARLFVNSAMTMADFILAVGNQKTE